MSRKVFTGAPRFVRLSASCLSAVIQLMEFISFLPIICLIDDTSLRQRFSATSFVGSKFDKADLCPWNSLKSNKEHLTIPRKKTPLWIHRQLLSKKAVICKYRRKSNVIPLNGLRLGRTEQGHQLHVWCFLEKKVLKKGQRLDFICYESTRKAERNTKSWCTEWTSFPGKI